MSMRPRNPWLMCHRRTEHPVVRLICFPYAGGAASAFAPWRKELPDDIELCAVQLPGREARFKERPLRSFHDELMPSLWTNLQFPDQVPCWLFGHSLGALLAFETARMAAATGSLNVVGLIASGCNAPAQRTARGSMHKLPDADFIEKLGEFNGTPAQVLANRQLMELLLPTIRADFELADDYRYRPSAPLNLPMAVFLGQEDRCVADQAAQGWAAETTGSCQVRFFSGDHFFIHQRQREFLDVLGRTVLAGAS